LINDVNYRSSKSTIFISKQQTNWREEFKESAGKFGKRQFIPTRV